MYLLFRVFDSRIMDVFYKRMRRCASLDNRADVILRDIYHVLEVVAERG
jgi:hypothetical protein